MDERLKFIVGLLDEEKMAALCRAPKMRERLAPLYFAFSSLRRTTDDKVFKERRRETRLDDSLGLQPLERMAAASVSHFFAGRSLTEKYPFAIWPNATARADFTRLRGNNKKALTGTAGVRGKA